jgi:hypothetical protein
MHRFILAAGAALAVGAVFGSAHSQPVADSAPPVPLIWDGTDLARTPGEPDPAVIILLEIRETISVYMAGTSPRQPTPAPRSTLSTQVEAAR